MATLHEDLAAVLNRHGAEAGSDTPDFILAEFLDRCLRAYDAAVTARSGWYSRHDAPGSISPPGDAARLSKLLFEAREQIEMWADAVGGRTGRSTDYLRGLVARIDAYRAERGWSPNGFGGEVR